MTEKQEKQQQKSWVTKGIKKSVDRETKYINKEKQQLKPWVTKGIKKSVDRETKYINNYWKRMM